MREGASGRASVTVDAAPEEVYDLVTDVRRIPEWSPECTAAGWVGGATGPAVGARFAGWNKRGLVRWRTVVRVDAAERPREFAFVMGAPLLGDLTRWAYRIAPGSSPGTSEVTETFEMVRDLPRAVTWFERYLLRVPDRQADLQRNLETGLERLRRVVERGRPTPG